LKGDDARSQFVKQFLAVKRLQTQLDRYTDWTDVDKQTIEKILPKEDLNALQGVYLVTAQRLKAQQSKSGEKASAEVDQLDFEFVLFASAVIDYDYIMGLMEKFSQQAPGRSKMTHEQLIGLIESDAKFMDDREDISQYVRSLKAGAGLDKKTIEDGYQQFKDEKAAIELAVIADKHSLAIESLQSFVGGILQRMIFDGEQLGDLLQPLELGWKARTQKELASMKDLVPLLKKRAAGRDISGLNAYDG